MASSMTKAVSFRIPVDLYIELLQEGVDKKLNITELLYLRIFSKTALPDEAEKQLLEAKIITLENALEESNQIIHDLEESRKELQVTHDIRGNDLESALQESLSYKDDLKNEIHILRQKLEYSYTKISEREEQNEDLETDITNLKSELNESKMAVRTLELIADETNEIKHNINSKGFENEKLRKENKALQESLVKSKALNSQLKEEKKVLDKGIQKANISSERSKELLVNEKKENSANKENIAKLNNTIKVLENNKELLKKDITSLSKIKDSAVQNYRTEQYISSNLRKDLTDMEGKKVELRDTHNRQIRGLQEVISGWVSYSPKEDASLFNGLIWE